MNYKDEVADLIIKYPEMRDVCDVRKKFNVQRGNTTKRDANGDGVELRMTFREWFITWGESDKWAERGTRRGQYCMSRYNDIGHYEVGNVFIQQHGSNVSEAQAGRCGSWDHLTPEMREKGRGNRKDNFTQEHKDKISQRFKGIEKTDAHKQAMKEAWGEDRKKKHAKKQTGKLNHASRFYYIIEGKRWDSLTTIAQCYGCTKGNVTYRCTSKSSKFTEWTRHPLTA